MQQIYYINSMIDDWLIDKFKFHHLDKPFFHGGVKQYKTHTRTATITSYLISYIHYKLKYKMQLSQKQPCIITIKYSTNIYKNKHLNTTQTIYNNK